MGRKIYLASSWRNPEQPELVKYLRDAGHEVYDFRNPKPGDDGFHWSELDREWLSWSPEQYIQQIESHPRAADGFAKEKAAMDWADTCVLLLPSGRSAHIEAGEMIGKGKPTAVLVRPEKFEPELMYLLADLRASKRESLLPWLAGLPEYIRRSITVADRWETQATAGYWALQMAPQAVNYPAAQATRLLQEVVEYCIAAGASKDAIECAVLEETEKAHQRGEWGGAPPEAANMELADVQILAWICATARGVHLQKLATGKMSINRGRNWRVTEDGRLFSYKTREERDRYAAAEAAERKPEESE